MQETTLAAIDASIDRAARYIGGAIIDSAHTRTEAYGAGLAALLDLRRQKLAATCPTCQGKGLVSKYGDDECLTPYQGRPHEQPLACPNRVTHAA
ncbi:hypothetical protein [Streptomyces chartreusis]|uniref:hypothetical protein n=1 Tax=Streptomyces chartreusis TaxID=1969 RepID=UPI00363E9E3D